MASGHSGENRSIALIFSEPTYYITKGMQAKAQDRNKHKPQASLRTPDEMPAACFFSMIKNTERQKQKRKEEEERRREKARWIAGLIDGSPSPRTAPDGRWKAKRRWRRSCGNGTGVRGIKGEVIKNASKGENRRRGRSQVAPGPDRRGLGDQGAPAGADELVPSMPTSTSGSRRSSAPAAGRVRRSRRAGISTSCWPSLGRSRPRGSSRAPHLAATPFPMADRPAFRGRRPGVPGQGRDRRKAGDVYFTGKRARKGETCLTLVISTSTLTGRATSRTQWSSPTTSGTTSSRSATSR